MRSSYLVVYQERVSAAVSHLSLKHTVLIIKLEKVCCRRYALDNGKLEYPPDYDEDAEQNISA